MTELYDDAELYDLQTDDYREDLAFYRHLGLDQGGPVLELGAGSGRVTVEFARVAPEVVALEPSASMRARLAARLEEAGVQDRVEVRDGDARELREEGRFDLVAAPFHMLMHLHTLADQDAVLTAARRALAPQGAFACDLFLPRFGAEEVLRLEAHRSEPDGSCWDLFRVQRDLWDRQTVVSEVLLDRTDPQGRVTRRRARLTQRYWHRFELERALRSAGFGDVRIFGDFDRRPFTEDARRIVAIARPG